MGARGVAFISNFIDGILRRRKTRFEYTQLDIELLLLGECLGNLFGYSVYRAIYIMFDSGYTERRVGPSA